ncbi:hypothetical protein DITRI_Ditri07aG0088500 [Diplodiscus trichospermus]
MLKSPVTSSPLFLEGFKAVASLHSAAFIPFTFYIRIFLHIYANEVVLCFYGQIIPETNRREISKYLFQEGVCYAKKNYNLAKHPEIDVPNLPVIKLMQSFKSEEYVRETFA